MPPVGVTETEVRGSWCILPLTSLPLKRLLEVFGLGQTHVWVCHILPAGSQHFPARNILLPSHHQALSPLTAFTREEPSVIACKVMLSPYSVATQFAQRRNA